MKVEINYKISDHINKHKRPSSDAEFGAYITGLIEASGCFRQNQLIITLHEKDIPLAYFIRSKLGYGKLYKLKFYKSIVLVIEKIKGIKKVLNLCEPYWISRNIIEAGGVNPSCHQITEYVQQQPKLEILSSQRLEEKIFNNFWLAGFFDSYNNLNFCIQPDFQVIIFKNQPFFTNYLKDSLQTITDIKKMIDYLDQYSLQSKKYIQYFIFRRAYRVIQREEHYRNPQKLIKYQKTLNKVYK